MNTLLEPSVKLARTMADLPLPKLEQIESIIRSAGSEIQEVLNPKVKPKNVFDAVELISGYTFSDLCSPSRKLQLCLVRHMCCYFLVYTSRESIYQVADLLNRDRTTIMNSIKVHLDMMLTNREYRKTYEKVLSLMQIRTEGGEYEAADA